MTKRSEKAKQTRRRIINAAMDLLKKKSFSDISVEDITNKSGVAKGSFYTYFPTKESIIFAMGDVFETLPAIEKSALPFLTRLRTYLNEYVQQVTDNGMEIFRIWLRYVTEPNQKKANNKWGLDIDLLTQIFNDAIARKELSPQTPVSDLVGLLNAQLYGFITAWCMAKTGVEPLKWVPKIMWYFKKIIEPYLMKNKE